MSERDDMLMTFLAILPDVEPEQAMRVLEATSWNVQDAIELQMASGGGASGGGAAGGMSGGGASAGAAAMDSGADDVRAPIPAQDAVLTSDGTMAMGQAPIMGFGADGMFAAAVRDTFRNFGTPGLATAAAQRGILEHAPGGEHAQELRGEGLTDMFAPPLDILTTGTWDEARAAAKEQRRWILANIQNMEEFSSHRLNRDTWKDDTIREIVRHNFILWQAYHDSPLGKEFLSKYRSVKDLPVIAVIDGRTGTIIKKFPDFTGPVELVAELLEILDKHEGDIRAFAAVGRTDGGAGARDGVTGAAGAEGAAAGGSVSTSGPPSPKRHRTTGEMTEEEALEAAIAASLNDAGGDPAISSGTSAGADAGAKAGADGDGDGDEDGLYESNPEPAKEVPPPPVIPDEPAQGAPDSTRLQLRLPDGSRLTRRFNKADPTSAVYGFARLSNKEALEEGKEFELVIAAHGTGATEVIPCEEDTLGDKGITNTVVTMRWVM